MSAQDKVDLLLEARSHGYRTYLYYVATEDPVINVSRVAQRVKMGGHGVPEDRIVTRYTRSLALLPNAVRATNRAYIFDNSGLGPVWLAEITDGTQLKVKSDRLPAWVTHALHEWFAGD